MQSSKQLQKEALAELAKRELARRHLIDFNSYVYPNYEKSWHIKLICEVLEKVISGEIRFLFMEAPPRHSKSVHVSQLFPAFVVGKNKDDSVMVASYSGDLAVDHGRETRNLINSQVYQNVFDTKLAEDSKAKGKWNTNGKGAYNAVGVGGSATGKGAKFFIIDDPFKDRKEADSELIRNERWRWFRSAARTRLTPDGRMIIMHTRWHEDDLIGRLTEGEDSDTWVDYFDYLEGKRAKWVRLRLPAVAEEDELFRLKGEALWPDKYPLLELEDIKRSLGPYEWSALYQQKPVDNENQEFQASWIKYCREDQVPSNLRIITTCDPAISEKDTADYTAIVTTGIAPDGSIYVLDVIRKRMNPTELINTLFDQHFMFDSEIVAIESVAFQQVFSHLLKIEMQKRQQFMNLKEIKTLVDKNIKIRGLIPYYQNGKIYHIGDTASPIENELFVFPKGKHDDCIDSLSMAISFWKSPLFSPTPNPMAKAKTRKDIMREEGLLK